MSEPLTSFERAARLFKEAAKLGCYNPTENMIADAIQDAEFDTLHNPEIISQRHGGVRTSVLMLGMPQGPCKCKICDSSAALPDKEKELQDKLGDLLAVIHGDGGHYQAEPEHSAHGA